MTSTKDLQMLFNSNFGCGSYGGYIGMGRGEAAALPPGGSKSQLFTTIIKKMDNKQPHA